MEANLYRDRVSLVMRAGPEENALWQTFVLENVGFEEQTGERTRKNAFTSLGAARLFIPAGGHSGQAALYTPPEQWQKMDEAGRKGRWTLQPGDLFLPGALEKGRAYSPRALLEAGKKPYVIARVEAFLAPDFGGRLAHWEVTSTTGLQGDTRRWGY